MNYYHLKSLIAASKRPFDMRAPSDSFHIAPMRVDPFVPPTLSKVEFPTERPPVLLVSAVGATGKSTLAQVLSSEINLPLLDLGKHKPVAQDSLTGLLTASFFIQDLSAILQNLEDGSYGLIIDGVDEARAKTTEKAFDAFLDNMAELCSSCSNTSFVLLGRSQILEYCWLYLTEKGIQAGLITIEPFDLASAEAYIDKYVGPVDSGYLTQYEQVRDNILQMLGGIFQSGAQQGHLDFLSFIGYPPVLDAIVTLLQEESNYYRLLAGLDSGGSSDVEIALLHRIAAYILCREKDEKVKPNILRELVEGLPETRRAATLEETFDVEEQCIRLVSWILGRSVGLKKIPQPSLDKEYEQALSTCLPEHPFLIERRFRNAVFESFALATLMVSHDAHCADLLSEYVRDHKYSYHLIYLLHTIAGDKNLPLRYLRIILGSAMEFRSTHSSVELHVDGPEAGDPQASTAPPQDVQIEISILLGKDEKEAKTFLFNSSCEDTEPVELGPRLSTAYVTLPYDVSVTGGSELELTAPVEVSAARVALSAEELILRRSIGADPQDSIILEADRISSSLVRIVPNEVPLTLAVSHTAGLTYPVIQYVQEKQLAGVDPLLQRKYLRLRRILLAFRSHKRGTLARYRRKIEHERVLQNDLGKAILDRLLADKILTLSSQHYFLEPDQLDRHLGVSWLDLRLCRTSEKLSQYLRSVE